MPTAAVYDQLWGVHTVVGQFAGIGALAGTKGFVTVGVCPTEAIPVVDVVGEATTGSLPAAASAWSLASN